MTRIRGNAVLLFAVCLGACASGNTTRADLIGRYVAISIEDQELPLVEERKEGIVTCVDVIAGVSLELNRDGTGATHTETGSECATPGSGTGIDSDVELDTVVENFRWRFVQPGHIELSFDGESWNTAYITRHRGTLYFGRIEGIRGSRPAAWRPD